MKYPGQPHMWRTVGIITVASILVILLIATAWKNAMPGGFGSMLRSTGSVGYENMMLGYAGDDSYATKDYAVSSAAPSPEEDTGSDEQKIIKTAQLSISVDGVQTSVDSIAAETVKQEGFVQSSQVSEDVFGNLTGWITIRVPSTVFESVIASIKNLAVHLESESRDAQDVTEQYTDLEARLTAAEAQEQQYLIILEDASTVGEVLAVEEHLADVRYRIESLQGQINYLASQTSYSTITVYLSEETRISSPTDRFDIVRDFKEAARYVVILAQGLLTGLVWILVVGIAIGVPLGILAWIGRIAYRRFMKK
ncbi:MAG: DUF4349 domain-containing protein [Candidatus Uhrbacteria bacterium]|nr:DUF4349 domain-containing protein [Candidatus Uhrbacteria bacterium]